MVRMAYTPNPVISMSKEARGCLNATTKVPRAFPFEAEYGSGLHRVDAKAEVQTTPAGIKTGVSRKVWADDESFLTHRLCAGSDVGRRNRTVTERAEGRGWQAGKHNPVECSRAAVDDGAAHDGAGLELFGHHAQCAYRFILGRIKVL